MNKCTSLFDLFHTDIWGYAPILFDTSHTYYIHFIDDFSKYSKFFVMKRCYDVTYIFCTFRTQIKNIFRGKIKYVYSDGAKEFLSYGF